MYRRYHTLFGLIGGWFGLHNWYAGKTAKGIVQISGAFGFNLIALILTILIGCGCFGYLTPAAGVISGIALLCVAIGTIFKLVNYILAIIRVVRVAKWDTDDQGRV